MAKLYDEEKESFKQDYVSYLQLMWATQDGKVKDYELLGYGTLGLHILKTLITPDQKVYNKEGKTDKKIPHFVYAINEQEDVELSGIGDRTGPRSTTQKASVKLSGSDYYPVLDGLIDHWPTASNPNANNNWTRVWIVAYSVKMGMIAPTGRIATLYRNDVKLGDNKKFAFCVKHCLELSPAKLKAAWQKANETPKKSNIAKVTPVEESQTAIAQALKDKVKAES
jgi:hypothetical protein